MEKKDIFDRMMQLPLLRIFEPFYIKHKEGLLYLFFGGLTTLISIFVFWACNSPLGINEHISNIVSWILAVLFAFVTNRTWVFNTTVEGRKGILLQAVSFYGGRLSTLLVEEIIIFVFITKLGMNSMLIKISAQIIVIVLNYVISKLFVFRK